MPIQGDLTGFKSALRSKTVWLAVIAALAAVPRIGAHVGALDPELLANTGGIVLDLITAVTGLGAAYTRSTATQKIGGMLTDSPTEKQ